MFITKGLVDYARQMEKNNNANEEIVELVNKSQLSYATNDKEIQSSRAAALLTNMVPPYVNNEEPMYNIHEDNNMFNVQLDYDINQARDLESWNGNFQAIFLHDFMEYLVLDIYHIKVSLTRMRNYILGKTIEGSKANNIENDSLEIDIIPLQSTLG